MKIWRAFKQSLSRINWKALSLTYLFMFLAATVYSLIIPETPWVFALAILVTISLAIVLFLIWNAFWEEFEQMPSQTQPNPPATKSSNKKPKEI